MYVLICECVFISITSNIPLKKVAKGELTKSKHAAKGSILLSSTVRFWKEYFSYNLLLVPVLYWVYL